MWKSHKFYLSLFYKGKSSTQVLKNYLLVIPTLRWGGHLQSIHFKCDFCCQSLIRPDWKILELLNFHITVFLLSAHISHLLILPCFCKQEKLSPNWGTNQIQTWVIKHDINWIIPAITSIWCTNAENLKLFHFLPITILGEDKVLSVNRGNCL